MLHKFTYPLQKAILGLSLLFFIIILGGTLSFGISNTFEDSLSPGIRLFLLLLFTVLIFLALQLINHHLAGCSRRRLILYTVLLFLIMAVVFLGVIQLLRIIPINDSHSLVDEALYLVRSGEKPVKPDGIYSNYLGKYSNNYLLALIFMQLFRFSDFIKEDPFIALYCLNIIFLLLGIFFTWHIACQLRGLAFALKVLLLCAVNPSYYILVFWVYSNTLSVPFMMGLLDLVMAFYKARGLRKRGILGACIGAVTATSFLVRPTGVIPVIALAFCLICYDKKLPFLKRQKEGRLPDTKLAGKAVVIMGLGLIAACSVFMGISKATNSYFHTVSDRNYPITHWLMMGSHGNGVYNLKDDSFTFNYKTLPEKKEATTEAVVANYKKLGISGTLLLWANKMITNWSDGYFSIDMRLSQPINYHWIYSWIAGEKNDLIYLYCQSFWMVILIQCILSCIRGLRKKEIAAFPFMLILSIFGAILFYFFWEVKSAYAVPFLPLFFLLAADGSHKITDNWQSLQRGRMGFSQGKRTFFLAVTFVGCGLCGISSFVIATVLATNVIEHHDYSVKNDNRSWCQNVRMDTDQSLVQTFYPSNEFNEIGLMVQQFSADRWVPSDCWYDAFLYDGEGNRVGNWRIDASCDQGNGRFGNVLLKTERLPADTDKGYALILKKGACTRGNLFFRCRKGLYLDSYPGELRVEGKLRYNDLYLQVLYHFDSPCCNLSTAILIGVVLFFLSGSILILSCQAFLSGANTFV